MSVELSDLKVVGCPDPSAHNNDSCYKPVTAAEVASACPTEVLIEVLVERGVLTVFEYYATPFARARYWTDWVNYVGPVAGGVS